MPVTYSKAPEVEEIARRLIAQHHTHLLELGHVRIEYLFRSEAASSNGKTVYGKARKLSGLGAFLALGDDAPEGRPDAETPEVEPFFVMEIAADCWATLTPKQRIALVDHELSHFKVAVNHDTGVKLSLAAHDLEEFKVIVERHGLWRSDIEDFVKAATHTQLSLAGDGDDGDGPAPVAFPAKAAAKRAPRTKPRR